MVNIYVLKLEYGKYYVGKTNNVNVRLNDHIRSKGSAWTRKYKLISVEHVYKNCDNFDEDKYTVKLMSEKGIDNVRGGSFCEIKLNQASKEIIQRMLRSKDDKCHFCGEVGHFIRNCPTKALIRNCPTKALIKINLPEEEPEEESEEESEVWSCPYCGKEFDTKKSATFHVNIYCKMKNSRKQRKLSEFTYYSKSDEESEICYNESDEEYEVCESDEESEEEDEVWSCSYCGKEFDTKKGATFHENVHCKMKNSRKPRKSSSRRNSIWCYRCGRDGHKSTSCYAKRDMDGDYI